VNSSEYQEAAREQGLAYVEVGQLFHAFESVNDLDCLPPNSDDSLQDSNTIRNYHNSMQTTPLFEDYESSGAHQLSSQKRAMRLNTAANPHNQLGEGYAAVGGGGTGVEVDFGEESARNYIRSYSDQKSRHRNNGRNNGNSNPMGEMVGQAEQQPVLLNFRSDKHILMPRKDLFAPHPLHNHTRADHLLLGSGVLEGGNRVVGGGGQPPLRHNDQDQIVKRNQELIIHA
jgi:hypothetical protein